MILNTRRLFCRLLRTLEIETVCDVGSMDGSDALLFRRALPAARILAFEPNPTNLALMRADERLQRARIRVLPFAASDCRSEAPFFVVEADYAREESRAWRGMSSLYRRSDGYSRLAEIVNVRTARLDEFLLAEKLESRPIALWIDAEGMAFEVVRGAAAVARSTSLIHVEVETRPVIGANQKLYAEVEKALNDAGFVLLATDQPRDSVQFNALFVRGGLPRARTASVFFWVAALRLRRIATSNVRRVVPRRVWRTLTRSSSGPGHDYSRA